MYRGEECAAALWCDILACMKRVLTRAGMEKMKERLSGYEKDLRDLRASKSEAAQVGGDEWHDNFSFEQLVVRENQLMAQIDKIKEIINQAEIISPAAGISSNGKVAIGSVVRIVIDGEPEKTITVTGFMESDPSVNSVSYSSPLGAALWGAKKGDRREVMMKKKSKRITIIDVRP